MLLLLFTGGCSTIEKSVDEKAGVVNGDVREMTASLNELPAFLEDKDENIQVIYSLGSTSPTCFRIPSLLLWMWRISWT